ncbi:MAG TPA: CHASE2 domain-containing protein, partial [Burkholderiaceae bacterium]|nr:CHASE2 domain-containing protein [Burkholderiaceae bacterium]
MTVFGLLLVALMAVVQVLSEQSPSHRSALNRLDLLLYDWRFQVFSPQRDHHIPIVIVDLDEATQQREGRWPWDRAKVADLLEAIRHHGAALTGFDVVFSEKTSNAIEQLMASDSISADLKSNLAPVAEQFDGDRIFAESLGFDTVLGFFFHADGASVGALPFPFFEWP